MDYLAKVLIEKALEHIPKILRAAEKAQQNKNDCAHPARRVSSIGEKLRQQQPETEVELLSGLGDTLKEAHELVVACENLNMVSQVYNAFNNADEYAEKFREVNRRIDSDLLFLTTFTRQISSPNNRAGVSNSVVVHHAASAATAPPSPAASGSSLSQQLDSATAMLLSNLSLLDPPRQFKSAEMVVMTNNFNHELSQDFSGTVYMGCLHGGPQVAVKRMRNKREEEDVDDGAFKVEVEILRDLRRRHENIASLVGWCEEDDDRMLVYDYDHRRNGTLGGYLHDGPAASLCWKARIKALLGVSRAIDHLHNGMPPVIHRNVSSSNILMDASWAPRLSGFDAAVCWEVPPTGQPMAEVVGTFGYVDPEYQLTKRVSLKSDVYSFGVVMLEALTGRPAHWRDREDRTKTLVGFALQDIENGNLEDVLDRRPAPKPTPLQMEALHLVAETAVHCLMPLGENRPAMPLVMANLATALGLLQRQT